MYDKIRKYWDKQAETRQQFLHPYHEEILNMLNNLNGTKILDVGCGDGKLLVAIAKKGKADLYGVDISPKMIERAKKTVKAKLFVVNPEEYPFEDEFFDIVVTSEVIEHVIDKNKFIKELNRLLKKNGKLILSTPNPWCYRYLIIKGDHEPFGGYERFVSPKKLKLMLRASGFKIEKFRGEVLPPDKFFRNKVGRTIKKIILSTPLKLVMARHQIIKCLKVN